MKNNNFLKGLVAIIFIVVIFGNFASSALYSDEALKVKAVIDEAKSAVSLMQGRDIPIMRVNESLQEAIQLFEGQLNIERQGRNAKYTTVLERANEVIYLKNQALKAQDELNIFLETYNDVVTSTNLSAMDAEYNAVIKSFEEERFEDTSGLIEKAYSKLSEVEASQTSLRIFYDATTRGVKTFLLTNWKRLISIYFYTSVYFWIVIILIVLYFSGSVVAKARLKIKLKNLAHEKESIKGLIKRTQYGYFKEGKISELEYSIKIKKFAEMIRDIDRQIPLIKEDLVKAGVDKGEYILGSNKKITKPIEEDKKEIKNKPEDKGSLKKVVSPAPPIKLKKQPKKKSPKIKIIKKSIKKKNSSISKTKKAKKTSKKTKKKK